MMSTAYAWLTRSFDVQGVIVSLRRTLRSTIPHASHLDPDPDEPQHPFDRTHHVDTGGLFYPDQLNSGHQHDMHSAGYYATAPSLFRGAIALWQKTCAATGYRLNDYAFIDIGCGKGRVLMLASEYPFRQVLGVELHPELAGVAQANLRHWLRHKRACRDVLALNTDALSVAIPDGPVVLYLFNSFEQQIVIGLLTRLAAISERRSAPIDLIYIHPEFDTLVRQCPRMELLADQDIAFTPEDTAADVFGVEVDRCSLYRLPGLLRA